MTNDELLAGFLDRSLSEDQLLEFEDRKQTHPEFAQEVSEMLTVEKLLVGSVPFVNVPTDFLSSVEHAVAAKVATGSSTIGFLTSLATNAWTWITGAAVIATGVYLGFSNGEQRVESVPQSQQVVPSVTQHVLPSVEPRTAPSVRTIDAPSVKSSGVREANNDAPRVALNTTSNDSAGVVVSNADRALDGLLKDLEKCRAAGDHVLCSQIALAIGRTYSQKNADTQAEQYLKMALLEAQNARLVQFEIEANGELGVVAQNDGRISSAKQLFKKAINLGITNGIQVDKWSKALEAIDK